MEGDDFNEPVTDNLRAILDGHLILSRRLANQGQYPAIDILESISRLFPQLANANEKTWVEESLRLLALYQESKDMIDVGAYTTGQNPELDQAVDFSRAFKAFVRQGMTECISRDEAVLKLSRLLSHK